MGAKPNFEQYLVETKVLDQEALKAALADAVARKVSLHHALVEKGALDAEVLAQALAKFHGVEFQPGPFTPDPEVLAQIPIFTLRRFRVLPLSRSGDTLTLATANPGNFLATDEIRRLTKSIVKVICTTERAIDEALAMAQATDTRPGGEASQSTAAHIDGILARCVARQASDIHFEPQNGYALVRERIDGILYEVEKLTLESFAPVLSRLKLLAGMDIVEKRLAQDGRFRYKHARGHCEIRTSTLPTIYGEKIVLRLLRSDKTDPNLAMLDIGPAREEQLNKICSLHDGLVLVAGPTGSGKTTTIYAMLHTLDRRVQNVIMIEDPVEYELDLANQVQVNAKLGVTFSSMLPYILRQDPDVLMVGEIREESTTQMVMRAAISGHLVFSSIHAPNAVGTLLRLADMGVQPHMITASLKACISQRLLRRLCNECKKPKDALKEDLELLGVEPTKKVTLYEAVGCDACHQLGYQGRFAVIEILVLDEPMKDAIIRREYKGLDRIAVQSGFQTLRDHAAQRVLNGETSIKELLLHCG